MNNKIWTKEFIMISCINFFATLMYFLFIVTIAGYAIETYGVSTSIAGFVSSIFIIGSLFGRLGAGNFISKAGPMKLLWIGLIGFFVSSLGYFVEVGVGFLLAVRLVQGIAVGAIGTATGTIIAAILPAHRRGEGIGYFSLSAILATAIGPFFGILMLKLEHSYTVMFTVNSVISILLLVLLLFVKIAIPVRPKGSTEEKTSFLSRFIEPKAVPISFIALLIGFAYSGVMSFLSFYAKDINLVNAASFFFLVYALVIIFTRPVTGRLMDQRGPNIIVYPCLAIFAVAMLLFSQATAGWMLLLAAALMGLGYGNFNSIAQTMAVKSAEPHRFGLATSTYFILFDIGLGFGPFILGYFEAFTTYRTIFLSMVPLIIICIPLYAMLCGRKEKAKAVAK